MKPSWYGALASIQVTSRSQSSLESLARLLHAPSRSTSTSLLLCEPNSSGMVIRASSPTLDQATSLLA